MPSDNFMEEYEATVRWIKKLRPQLEYEAQRRGTTPDEFVTHMLDDVYEIYSDESDNDIAEGQEAIKATQDAIRSEGASIEAEVMEEGVGNRPKLDTYYPLFSKYDKARFYRFGENEPATAKAVGVADLILGRYELEGGDIVTWDTLLQGWLV